MDTTKKLQEVEQKIGTPHFTAGHADKSKEPKAADNDDGSFERASRKHADRRQDKTAATVAHTDAEPVSKVTNKFGGLTVDD